MGKSLVFWSIDTWDHTRINVIGGNLDRHKNNGQATISASRNPLANPCRIILDRISTKKLNIKKYLARFQIKLIRMLDEISQIASSLTIQ